MLAPIEEEERENESESNNDNGDMNIIGDTLNDNDEDNEINEYKRRIFLNTRVVMKP